MNTDVVMPLRGAAEDEPRIVRWLKAVGDPVAEGEMLLEIETTKTVEELPAPCSGVLSGILVPEDGHALAGTVLATIESQGA